MLLHRNTTKRSIAMLVLDALAPVLGAVSTLAFTLSPAALVLYLGGFAGFLLYIGASDILPQAHSSAGPAVALRLFALTGLGAAFIHTVVRLAG
jgi:ZIP family zinc transporter